jgi:uncharacterized protein (DUF2141 family)
MMKINPFMLAFLFLFPEISKSQSVGVIYVNIEEIEMEQGTLRIGLFTENDKFLEVPSYSKDVPANGRNSVQVSFENIPYGTYAISIYQDLDDNEELDTNFIGIPKEPVGFSNDHQPKMSAPNFKGAKFILDEPSHTQTVKMYTY